MRCLSSALRPRTAAMGPLGSGRHTRPSVLFFGLLSAYGISVAEMGVILCKWGGICFWGGRQVGLGVVGSDRPGPESTPVPQARPFKAMVGSLFFPIHFAMKLRGPARPRGHPGAPAPRWGTRSVWLGGVLKGPGGAISGAEALVDFVLVTARLKPCPYYKAWLLRDSVAAWLVTARRPGPAQGAPRRPGTPMGHPQCLVWGSF